MTEYIKREAVMELLSNVCTDCEQCMLHDAKEKIVAIPAANVCPVVHGKWVYDCERTNPDGSPSKQYHCSECKGQIIGGISDFCPNCGAKMDGGDN